MPTTLRARAVVAGSVGLLAAVLLGGPAAAHVEVEADNAQAGARDVTLTFHGEAESTSAGIKAERVVLPAGIKPADVRLVKAPGGWIFTAGSDGFTVAGRPLKTGQDAEFSVRVAQLPTDAKTLSFKTLETYGDGTVSRWIEVPQAGQPEPDNPAPTLTLKPAATVATASPSVAATPTQQEPTPPNSTASGAPTAAAEGSGSGGSHAGWWIALAVLVVLAAGALVWWRRRNGPAAG
ncbi:DUF1775 domain-containing protein [Plantactinospora siamensis]|uniref:DUF1775 domain-containing protein n=1 Tax=Plantactinospora siamensis TaxID=555372 RepID=A0ABV6P660_9ACTN